MTFLSRKTQRLSIDGEMSFVPTFQPTGPISKSPGHTSPACQPMGCQWIDGPVNGDDDCKCGKPVVADLPGRAPYCAEHAPRCFESAAAWRKRNAWLGELDASFSTVSLRDWMGEQE